MTRACHFRLLCKPMNFSLGVLIQKFLVSAQEGRPGNSPGKNLRKRKMRQNSLINQFLQPKKRIS